MTAVRRARRLAALLVLVLLLTAVPPQPRAERVTRAPVIEFVWQADRRSVRLVRRSMRRRRLAGELPGRVMHG